MKPDLTQAMTASLLITLAELDAVSNNQQWVHLLPMGQFSASDGRGPWLVDNAEQVITNTLERAGSRKIPIDYDHQIDRSAQNGQPAIAAGWITQLQERDDGIWGLAEWTDKASAHLAAKEYRYLSPVIHYDASGKVTRISRAALVNNPALELTALASEQAANLQEELTDTQDKLQTALAQLESFQQEAKTKETDQLVDTAAAQGRILPFQKEFAAKLCALDTGLFGDFVKLVERDNLALFKEVDYGQEQEHAQALSEDEKTICKALGHTHEEFTQLGKDYDY